MKISDFCLFISVVYFICAAVSIIIPVVRTKKILQDKAVSEDMIKFYKNKWCNENQKKYFGCILIHLIVMMVAAWFHLIPVMVIASIAEIIAYSAVNIQMMNYVEKKVDKSDKK